MNLNGNNMTGQVPFASLMAMVPIQNVNALAPAIGPPNQRARKTLWSRLRFTSGENRDPEKERIQAQQMMQRQFKASNAQRRGKEVRDDVRPPRFGLPDEAKFHPPPILDTPTWLSGQHWDIFLKEQRLEELSNKLGRGDLEFGDPDLRPPSPAPTYDRIGTRTNTRDVRVRAVMNTECNYLNEFLLKKVGQDDGWFVPAADWKAQKKVVRITIPQDRYKEHNFMGLIIGPRGCNHKRLEAESGAQISIRGQGTLKEGKKTDHQTEEEANLPQHVHISADEEHKIEKAVALIEPLLDPQHPMHEDFKNRGLDQLALVQGTTIQKPHSHSLAIAGTMCEICGKPGHFSWKCPEAHEFDYERAEVQCALCGDRGHPTMDCRIVRDKKLTSKQVAELEKRAKATRKTKQTRLERLKAEAQGLQESQDQIAGAQTTPDGMLLAALPSTMPMAMTGHLPTPPGSGDYDRLIGDLFGEAQNQAYKRPCHNPTSQPNGMPDNGSASTVPMGLPGMYGGIPMMPGQGSYQGMGSGGGGYVGYGVPPMAGGYTGYAPPVYGAYGGMYPPGGAVSYGAGQGHWNPYYAQQGQQQWMGQPPQPPQPPQQQGSNPTN